MASRLYVGNLSYSTTDDGLRNFFAAAGDVKTAEVVIERASGRSKGFGFVEMETDEGANNAIAQLNGKMLDQRPIRIDFAKPKEDRPRSFSGAGGGAGGGGGYSRDGGDRPRSFSNGGGGGGGGGGSFGGGGFGGGRGGSGNGRGGGGGGGGRDRRDGGGRDRRDKRDSFGGDDEY